MPGDGWLQFLDVESALLSIAPIARRKRFSKKMDNGRQAAQSEGLELQVAPTGPTGVSPPFAAFRTSVRVFKLWKGPAK